jgi:Uma2 family endonuclease
MRFMSTAELTTYTADDLLHLPDGDRYELVDGQLVETNMGALSSWVGGSLYAMLQSYSENGSKGWAFPADTGLQCFPDDREKVRRPDAFFVGRGRFENEQVPDRFVRVAPDVVAEVVSPNDQYYAVEHKIWEYLEAGVRLAWIVNPRQRTIMVYRGRGGDPSYLTEKDELSGEDVLPGFRVQVAAIFPALQDANESNAQSK